MNKANSRKIGSLFIIALLILQSAPLPARAEWVAPDFSGNIMGATAGQMQQFIKESIAAAMKTVYIEIVSNETNNNISSGADGSPMWITDWRKALSTEPKRVSQLQMKNFFSKLGGGKNGNYVSSSGGAGAGSIISNAENAVMDMSVPKLINLAEYGADNPSEVFSENNFRAFMAAYGSSGKNIGNGIEATLLGYDKKAKLDEENEKIASVQAQAYGGFAPATENGQVLSPGSTIRDLVSKAQGMSFDNLSTSKTIGEVVGSLVTRAVSRAIHKGIGNVRQSIQGSGSGQTFKSTTTSYGNLDEE